MAFPEVIRGELCRPTPELTTLKRVSEIPIGDLHIPFLMTTVLKLENTVRAGRFPTPAAAMGFLTRVFDAEGDLPYRIPPLGLRTPYLITGAVYPESDFLEPTKGQIWPRIG